MARDNNVRLAPAAEYLTTTTNIASSDREPHVHKAGLVADLPQLADRFIAMHAREKIGAYRAWFSYFYSRRVRIIT